MSDERPRTTTTRADGVATVVVSRVAPFGACLMAGTALVAAVLVPVGLWRPLVVWPVLLVVAALSWRAAATVALLDVARRPAWACTAVAAACGLWAALTHAEHLVLRRDAGSYALYAHWIATRGHLPVDADLGAFGGTAALADHAFTLDSPAYYQVVTGSGAHVVPQFFVGTPAWYGLGWWTAGWTGLFVMPAITTALALLAFSGLLLRWLPPGWVVAATVLLGTCQPVLHAARSTYSEPGALLLILVAAALTGDALTARAGSGRAVAVLAGLLLGLAGLVRVDALREVALVLPVLAFLAVRRVRAVAPLTAGLVAGTAVSAAAAVALSRPYLHDISDSVVPLVALTLALAVLSAGVVLGSRRGWRVPGTARLQGVVPDRLSPLLPRLAAAGMGLGWLVLLSRPWWLTVLDDPDSPVSRMVDGFQRAEGLPLVAGRTYAEDSLIWVAWWLGPLAVVLTAGASVVLAWRLAEWWRGGTATPPGWAVPATVGLGSTVLTLWRPGITPDHPWADRRLVPVVLPVVVAVAAAALSWVWERRSRRMRVTAGLAMAVTLAWALSASLPVVALRTERGEPAAVEQVCAGLSPQRDVVLAVDARGYNEWVQVVRGVCGVPAAAVRPPTGDDVGAAVARLSTLAQGQGRRVVLLAAQPDTDLAALQASPLLAVDLHTREDQRFLERRPIGWVGLDVVVRLAVRQP